MVEFASSLHFEAPLVPRYGGDKIWVLGMHVNDQVPLMARIEGLDRLVATAIEAHEKHEKRECSRVSVDVDFGACRGVPSELRGIARRGPAPGASAARPREQRRRQGSWYLPRRRCRPPAPLQS